MLRLCLRSLCVGLVLVAWTGTDSRASGEWSVALFSGMEAGGVLYKATSDAGNVNWSSPGGQVEASGNEVRAELEEFGVLGLRVSRKWNEHWGVSASLSLSDIDVRALVRTEADNLDRYDWDQFFVTQAHVVATWDLLPQGNTLYLLGGLGWASVQSEGTSLDKSAPALVYGAGFRLRSLGRALQFDLEVRDAVASFDFDDEEARLDDLATGFDGKDRVHLVDVTVAWVLSF